MFRSFFPVPKLFFGSAVLWMLLTTLLYQFAGDPVRSVVSIDRFLAPAICAPSEVPAAETIPPYELFRADALGNLWIGEYLLPGETQRTWTIIGSDGKAIGRLTTPPRTLPLEIGPDYLLGLTRDELDVETLTLWPLTRPM